MQQPKKLESLKETIFQDLTTLTGGGINTFPQKPTGAIIYTYSVGGNLDAHTLVETPKNFSV